MVFTCFLGTDDLYTNVIVTLTLVSFPHCVSVLTFVFLLYKYVLTPTVFSRSKYLNVYFIKLVLD